MLLQVVARQLAVRLHVRLLAAPIIRAVDEPVFETGAADAVRVLLLGSGVTTGWGVHTHGLALAGALQRDLSARLQRPVDVIQVSAIGATLSDAVAQLGARAKEDWDVIVVAFGANDALRLTAPDAWAQAAGRLLARLDRDMPRGLLVPIVFAGVPESFPLRAPGPLAVLVRRHALRLDQASRQVLQHNRRAVFVGLPRMANEGHRPDGSAEAYVAWSDVMAAQIAEILPRDLVRVGDGGGLTEAPEPLTEAVLAPSQVALRSELRSIAEHVRDAVEADLVLINLVNGDRFWSVGNSADTTVRSTPIESTFCAEAMRVRVLAVPDVGNERGSVFSRLTPIHDVQSYLGVALEDDYGSVVGTICTFNGFAGYGYDVEIVRSAAVEVEQVLGRVRHPGSGMQLFAPRAVSSLVELSPERAAAAPNVVPAATPVTAEARLDDLPIRAAARRMNIRHLLSGEGRRLTGSAADRVTPAERDFRVHGDKPIRVLLIGGEYAVGFGVDVRGDALDGALARLLHLRTGRGVQVENRSLHQVSLEQLAGSLGPAGAHTFDLVVWAPTFDEATRVLLRSRWIAGLGLLLRRIQNTSNASTILLGMPRLLGSQPLAILGRARATQLNRIIAAVARHFSSTEMVELPPIELASVDAADGRSVYWEAAMEMLPTAMRLLDAQTACSDRIQSAVAPIEQHHAAAVLRR